MPPTLRLLQKARWRRRIRVMLWWTGSLWCETRSVLKWSYFYKKYDTNHFRPFSCVIVFPILWWHLCLTMSKGTFDWPCSGTGIYSNDEEKSIGSHGRTKYTSTGIMCYKSYWLQLEYISKTDILRCMSFSLFFFFLIWPRKFPQTYLKFHDCFPDVEIFCRVGWRKL